MALAALIDRQARQRADAVFARRWDTAETITYGQAASGAAALSACIARRIADTVEKRPIAIAMRNSPELVIALAACEVAGRPPAMINWRLNVSEMSIQLAACGADTLIADEASWAVAREAAACAGISELLPVEAIQMTAGAEVPRIAPCLAEPPGFILFTSGTTGQSRAAMFSGAALEHFGPIGQGVLGLSEGDTGLVALPCFHTAALHGQVYPALFAGSELIFYGGSFEPARIASILAEHNVTWTLLGSRRINELVTVLGADHRLPHLHLLVAAGGALAPAVVRTVREYAAPDLRLLHVMGMTEVGTYMLVVPSERFDAKNGALGQPNPPYEVRIDAAAAVHADPSAINVASGGRLGEMMVRGPTLIERYAQGERGGPDEQGWFRTGDLVRIDEEGYIWFVDRIKDVIKTGGENVSPAGIRDVILQHPSVRNVAVVGVPHEKWGEAIGALLVVDSPAPSPEEIVAWCREHLSSYKRPRFVAFTDEIPTNESGRPRRDLITRLLLEAGEVA